MALFLEGVLEACGTTGGGVNRKTGEAIPLSHKIQILDTNDKGLRELQTLTVPDLSPYTDKVGQRIKVPVRAWASNTPVNLMFIG